MNTCSETKYTGIAPYYDQWSSGDWAWESSRAFYQALLMEEPGEEFLELGIGNGSISLQVIGKRSIRITGVDLSDGMLDICRGRYEKMVRAGANSGQLILRKQDMCDLAEKEKYDCVILPFRTVGHLLRDEQLEKLFRGVWDALKPGRHFVLDHYMFNSAWAQAHHGQQVVMYRDGGVEICDRYHYDFRKGSLQCQVSVNGLCVEQFEFRWMETDLIRRYAVAVGFQVEKLLGDYDGSLWDPSASEQIWILRK